MPGYVARANSAEAAPRLLGEDLTSNRLFNSQGVRGQPVFPTPSVLCQSTEAIVPALIAIVKQVLPNVQSLWLRMAYRTLTIHPARKPVRQKGIIK